MTEQIKPATDEEIAHGRISLDEMYACKDCPTERGGRCFRCSIHPAILARIDADREKIAEMLEALKSVMEGLDTFWEAEEGKESVLKANAVIAKAEKGTNG